MSDIVLLDTPKRTNLQTQATTLRTSLKEFEHTFAQQHGRKPKQADIKQEPEIARTYKFYQRVQQVLAGKLAYAELSEVKARSSRCKKPSHDRQDSGYGTGLSSDAIASEDQQHDAEDSLTTKESSTPQKGLLVRGIGPTPHRDGRVLGFFDLLPNSRSSHSSCATPSSSTRKRKIAELFADTPVPAQVAWSPTKPAETPSLRRKQAVTERTGDLLDHLDGTSRKTSSREHRVGKHSRTPVSEGKKFQLNQFFATPSTDRFLLPDKNESPSSVKSTPLKELLFANGVLPTPQRELGVKGKDETPAYFKRSTSFKDRLLGVSASRPSSRKGSSHSVSESKVNGSSAGPPTLRYFRSSTSNIFRQAELAQREVRKGACDIAVDGDRDDHDDDLDALRELESGQANRVLVDDSQIVDTPQDLFDDLENQENIRKPYKKKGQKRTTRKANIRPVAPMTQRVSAVPKFVSADASDGEEEVVDETQFPDNDGTYNDDFDEHNQSSIDPALVQEEAKSVKKVKSSRRQAGTINPNAQSHQNFRSLKIKNKNSKAKGGGRGNYGRKR